MKLDTCKQLAAHQAMAHVSNHMLIGLGTGSTVYFFIQELIQKVQKGLDVRVVASSERSTQQAKAGGLLFADIQKIESIDLTVDGADAIDNAKMMIKGGGGALFREKILAAASKKVVIIVDETKVVKNFVDQKLPVEILPFGAALTLAHIRQLGFQGSIRLSASGSPFLTDNGNYIFDVILSHHNPEKDHSLLKNIPGVCETGFFFNLAHEVYIGYQDGHVETR